MSVYSWGLISALSLAGNSFLSQQIFKATGVRASLVSLFSFLPAFLLATFLYFSSPFPIVASVALILALKDVVYGYAFSLRLDAVQKHGGFSGNLIVASQPILVSIFGFLILKEKISGLEGTAVFLSVAGLACLGYQKHKPKELGAVLALSFVPALLMAFVMLCDRFVLREHLDASQFFILDKIVLLPAFYLGSRGMLFIRKRELAYQKIPFRFAPSVIFMGLLWLLSSYSYGVALSGASAGWVSVIRNLSYPLVSLISLIAVREHIPRLRWWGFASIVIATGILWFD